MFRSSLFGCLLLLLSHLPTNAQETVTLTGGNNIIPVMYMSETGPTGFAVEIAKEALTRAGLKVNTRLFPWARAVAISKHGDAFITGFSYTEERSKDFAYTDLLVNEAMVLVTLAGHEITYDKPEDLAGRQVGFHNGATFGDEFENLKRFISQDPDTQTQARLQKLMLGRLDAAIFAQSMISYFPELFSVDTAQITVLPRQVGQSAMYLAIAKNSPHAALIPRINKAIAEIHADGTVEKLYIKKYQFP